MSAGVKRKAKWAPATWDAVPLPGGGWRIVVPGRPVSSNQSGGGHEHWTERKRRLDGYVNALTYLRLQHGLRDVPVLPRAMLCMTCYFPARKRRDPHNYGPGAGGKALVDALTLGTERAPRSGWVTDDAPEFLRVDGEPSIEVGELRTEIVLTPWEGGA
ncbi:MAG: hypothetical protein KGK07_14490 [Chloroflexota bacterium]|nr:hypothetical protein [Chloroflexota bacterium]